MIKTSRKKLLENRIARLEKLLCKNEDNSLDFSFEDPEIEDELVDVQRSVDYDVDFIIESDDVVVFTTEHLEISVTQEDGYFHVLTMDSYGDEQPRPYTGKTYSLDDALRKVVRAISNLEYTDDEEEEDDEDYESLKRNLKSRKAESKVAKRYNKRIK